MLIRVLNWVPVCSANSATGLSHWSVCCFHNSSIKLAGSEWRRRHGQPSNPTAYGPLTDGPDYLFVDGRPTPPGRGKIKRAKKQYEISKKIMTALREVDFAVEYHKERIKTKQIAHKSLMESKLIPKGKKTLA